MLHFWARTFLSTVCTCTLFTAGFIFPEKSSSFSSPLARTSELFSESGRFKRGTFEAGGYAPTYFANGKKRKYCPTLHPPPPFSRVIESWRHFFFAHLGSGNRGGGGGGGGGGGRGRRRWQLANWWLQKGEGKCKKIRRKEEEEPKWNISAENASIRTLEQKSRRYIPFRLKRKINSKNCFFPAFFRYPASSFSSDPKLRWYNSLFLQMREKKRLLPLFGVLVTKLKRGRLPLSSPSSSSSSFPEFNGVGMWACLPFRVTVSYVTLS